MMYEYKTTFWGVVLAIVLIAPSAFAQFSISGAVRDGTAAPVAGVRVRLFDDNDNPIGIPPLQTDGAGFYIISGLPSGQYVVQFDPPVATRLLAVQQATSVSGGNAVLNVVLQPGNLLSGYVRDVNGVGIPSIDLQVVDRNSGNLVLTPGDDTDATGFYDVVIPDGEFDLEWRAVSAGSPPWLSVTRREIITTDTVIDVVMVLGYIVSGTVRDTGGVPIVSVNMDFIDADTGVKLDTPGDNTNAAGFYSVQVPAGVYVVRAKPQPALRLAAGELVDVVIVADTPGIDFVLQPGVVISGRVTRADNGSGVAGVDIDVADAVTGEDIFVAFDKADDFGFYDVVIPPGLVEVTYEPAVATGLVPHRTAAVSIVQDTVLNQPLQTGVRLSGTVSDDQGAGVGGVDIDAHDLVTGLSVPLVGDNTDAAGDFTVIVAPGAYDLDFEPPKVLGLVAERRLNQIINVDTTVNVSLQPGSRVTGTVTDPGGQVVAGVDLDVFLQPGDAEVFTPADNTDAFGRYEIIIPSATYRFVYQPGLAAADLDSLELFDVVIAGDRVIDVELPYRTGVAVEDATPDRSLVRGLANFPNPFNPATVIDFELTRPARVRLAVYTVAGDLVVVLADDELAAGRHAITWRGSDGAGRALPSGVYVYRVSAGSTVVSGKMLLTR